MTEEFFKELTKSVKEVVESLGYAARYRHASPRTGHWHDFGAIDDTDDNSMVSFVYHDDVGVFFMYEGVDSRCPIFYLSDPNCMEEIAEKVRECLLNSWKN